MENKRLEWTRRAQNDRLKIVEFYAQEASPYIADEATIAIRRATLKILDNPLAYRDGKKSGTREYTMRRFPYCVIYKTI